MHPHPSLPEWVPDRARPDGRLPHDRAAVGAAVDLAVASARAGGGPFGALILDAGGRVVAAGWNRVIPNADSTAHAEVEAIRAAQGRLGTHDLSTPDSGPFTLHASCAPCVMCFGAIYWSGLRRVVAGATAADAGALGFDEGPVTDGMWEVARRRKEIAYEPEADADRDVTTPFAVYRGVGGVIY